MRAVSEVEGTTRVRAVRGAVQAEGNTSEAIAGATEELVTAMMERNGIGPEGMISAIFTVTADLDADFPASAARGLGLSDVPLLCSMEIPVPGAMARVIRALIHYEALAGSDPVHVYLGDTTGLRPDLASGGPPPS